MLRLSSCFFTLSLLVLAGCESTPPPTDGGVDGSTPIERCERDDQCDDGLFCNGTERCAPTDPAAETNGCVLAASPCLESQRCLEEVRRCETVCAVERDADGDGHDAIECAGDDCDDSDPNRFPGNGEICDPTHDEDCDATTLGRRDADGDDVTSDECCNVIDGVSACGTDCNDSVASVYPGATEICDGLDGDCNGFLDGPGEDDDLDGRADNGCAGRGGTDCDDEDATVYLGADEICDGKDNDCAQGGVDGEDLDDDGQVPPTAACEGGPFPRTDCDDTSADAYGGATEVCNGGDDDCDGASDEAAAADAACTVIVGRGLGLCSEAACHRQRCDVGWADCDHAITTGCETDLTTRTASCGGCGISCAEGARCIDGQCEAPLRVTAGRSHTCALFPSGAVSCWGQGRFGQLGSGVTDDAIRPERVMGLPPARSLAGTTDSTCAAVDPDGSVWCWGESQPPGGSLVAVPLPGAPLGVVELSGRGEHHCARTATGEVWCWGFNGYGQLGDGTRTARAAPVRATVPAGVVQVAAGLFGTCVRLASGQVWCWGSNGGGALGNGSTVDSLVPVRVSNIADATAIAYGPEAGCAVRATGQLWCWGANQFSPYVGDGTAINRPTPVRTGTFTDAVDVDFGVNAACVVRSTGQVMCWGANVGGVLGDGTFDNRNVPVLVSGLSDATRVSVGSAHACATHGSGAITCWGINSAGELGDGSRIARTYPTRTDGTGDAVAIAGGSEHACVVDSLGGVSCAGDDRFGQRGDGAGFGAASTVPTRVASLTSAVAITSGAQHVCALRADGTVACWGSNAFGQLGDGGTDHGSCATHPTAGPGPTDCSAAPVTVAGLTDVVQISASAWSTCAVRRSGTVACWGEGPLGNGNGPMPATPPDTCRRVFVGDPEQTRCALSPVDVSGITDAVEVSVGASHACARRAAGAVVCWGGNLYGELGDGTRMPASVPVPVRDVRGATSIATASAQSCARIDDGTLRCWGREVAVPIAVTGLTDVASLAGGGNEICIVRAGGSAGCFQVAPGVGAPATPWTGSAAVFRDGFTDLALPPTVPPVGGQLACVLSASGGIACRGDNDRGQLADGTMTNQTTLTPWRLR